MSKHEWILEVYRDLAKYAEENELDVLLQQIELALPILASEIGPSSKFEAAERQCRAALLHKSREGFIS